ncbi:putative transcriptional regulatory protein C1F7.11c [Hypsizygus marmoreus]|uniref:Transcriptional regulatory protein C1F7.11c n=1 Tax=Hypsizygus marmoreus TaxID=39966 RepID=A0A369J004_HYPMA|nr:putative transcriptional regulatory protein C1F7.11c [Hypsizygus marmoreus]
MASSPDPANHNHNHQEDDPRPLKRPRKARASRESDEHQQQHTFDGVAQHVDHIFIAEGNVGKKPSGKKAPLSCCECRRLKLKCDRNFPCASCKKRGCAEICPEGVLVSGKGTRFILANTEQLHTKIHEMSDRIRHLEEALEELQAHHPLLASELLGIKSTMGLYGGTQVGGTGGDGSGVGGGMGRDGEDGEKKMNVDGEEVGDRGLSEEARNGNVAGTGNGNGALVSKENLQPQTHNAAEETPDAMFAEVVRLSQCYPLPDNVSPEPNLGLREYIRAKLPDRAEAEHLWEQALQNALWQYNPHPSETFFPNLAHHCYTSPTPDLSPRRLALLFMILAVGCLVDLEGRNADSPDAEMYHQFARAALCEIPVMEETNVETITALFYEIWYLLVFSDKKKAAGYAWGLMGLTAKLAQSIGLHRNGGGAKVIPEEVEKRRSLFWELLYLDARLSLSLGRPPSLCSRYMDCQRPSYSPDHGCDPSRSLHYYQEWKHSCYTECLAPVLDVISQPSLEYGVVLDLDTKIRDFSFPLPLRNGAPHTRALLMQKASLSIALEAVLLQLHRSFFTRALSGPEESFNRRHKYAPSVVAVFLSASRMIATVQDLYNREPQLTARILGYWSNAFSAAVALCLLVSRAPFTCLSPAALQELERARMLFKSAKDTCPRALQVIPILETMVNKANDIYTRWSDGQEIQTVLQHVVNDDPNELDSMAMTIDPYQQQYPIYPGQQQQQTYVSPSPPPASDPFARTHRSLSQCIVEVHQRAKAQFPNRKPCSCSKTTKTNCPPSHFWSPPPNIPQQTSPVLPDLYSSSFVKGVLPAVKENGKEKEGSGSGGGSGREKVVLEPTSKMAVVDTLNFELGSLPTSQTWMSFF